MKAGDKVRVTGRSPSKIAQHHYHRGEVCEVVEEKDEEGFYLVESLHDRMPQYVLAVDLEEVV